MAAPFVCARSSCVNTLARIRKRGLKTREIPGKESLALEFGVLGSLEVYRGSSALPLGGQKQRALLTLLLLHANEVVSSDRLIDGVWGERPPRTVGAALRVYLSKLRKLLGSDGSDVALLTRPPGYMLAIEPEQLDLHRFERLVREGREALAVRSAEKATARLGEALALWRGPPLADLGYAPFAASTVARLVELRLCALEDRIEAELALGHHSDLVPEIEALVAEYPLRERLRAQLMVALYRTGRQAEALQAYRAARRLLAEELGIDPGPELRHLEKAILVHDPSLAPAPASPAAAGHRPRRLVAAVKAAGSHPGALWWSSRLLPALAAILAVAVAVPIFVVSEGGRAGTVFARGNDVAVVEPQTNKVIARVRVGSSPTLIREGDGSVWVADEDEQTVTQIDPKRRRVVRTIGIGFRPDDLAARDGAVWAFDKEGGILEKLPYEEISDRFERRGFAGFDGMAVDDEAVWLSGGKRLIRVDPETGRIVKRADVPGDLNGVAVGAGAVWAVSGPAATVLRIDPHTAAVTDRIAIVTRPSVLTPHPIGIAADGEFVWVLNGNTATVTKIDPELHVVVAMLPLRVGRGSIGLAAGQGAAWVSNEYDGTVTRIDAETDAMTSITVAPHDRPTDITVAGGLVWVSVDET
jgi:DNA-binding SARP family transcriptional activator